jgi:hypothetical protein
LVHDGLVQLGVVGESDKLLPALQAGGIARAGIRGDHHVLARVQRRSELAIDLRPLPDIDGRSGMTDAGRDTEHDREVELLAQLIGSRGEGIGLRAVGRLDDGNLRRPAVVPAILLVLRGVHIGVVGCDEYKTPLDTGIGEGEEGVGGNVKPDVLHSDERTRTGQRRADGGLERALLIDGPLDMRDTERGKRREYLRRGCAGITAAEVDTGLPRPARDGFIP